MIEAFTKGVEAVFCNILSNGGALPTPKRSPRRKKMEDVTIQLEKATEPSQHRDFILVSPGTTYRSTTDMILAE